jgi:drug/metabolite transporter (DMT)-like permease
MAPVAEIAALGAAMCVALSNIIAIPAIRHFGPFAFNRFRLLAAFAILAVVATLRSGFTDLLAENVIALGLSALVGIVIGDTAIYAAMARIGPRRTSLLYACYAPITAVFAAFVLGERSNPITVVGIALAVVGVWLAIYYRRVSSRVEPLEDVRGNYSAGIGFGLLGALCAAGAALIMQPVMATGVDASGAACIRIALALPALYGLGALPNFRSPASSRLPMLAIAALAGALGMGAGMTLLLFALSRGPAGVVTALASTTPIMLLPLLWIVSGVRPDWRAWIGAILAFGGVLCIVLRAP